MKRYASLFTLTLIAVHMAACTTQEWYERKPEPPERCIPVTDGVRTQCVPVSKFAEWVKRNGL